MFTKDKIYETGLILRLDHVFDQEKHHAKLGSSGVRLPNAQEKETKSKTAAIHSLRYP